MTTLSQIAAEADMTRAAIYWHFENKDAVIQALWERNDDRLHMLFSEMLEQVIPPHPAQHFRDSIKNIVRSVVSEPELGQVVRIVMHNVEFSDEQTKLQRFLMNKKESLYFDLENVFRALQQHKALRVDLSPRVADL